MAQNDLHDFQIRPAPACGPCDPPGRLRRQLFLAAAAVLLALLAITAGTYAWFSSNRTVSTDSVQGRSGTDTVTLLLGTDEDLTLSARYAQSETAILQVNTTAAEELLPVSTADLATFVYNPSTIDDLASTFALVEDESYYYHGRVYLRAVAEGLPEAQLAASRLALYFDTSNDVGGALAEAEDDQSTLLYAARLGLTFDGESPIIFRLAEDDGLTDAVYNTVIDGVTLGDGQVLDASAGLDAIRAVDDPAVSLASRTLPLDGGSDADALRELQPLALLELNHTYAVDIYFYLEGCDPACSNDIFYDAASLHLAFYGILTETEEEASA
jgi:predicted ribosomally synthesized peptide with SipW-like signal peptide